VRSEDAGETGIEHCALLLRLREEFLGDRYLRCATVVTEDERALMLIREQRVTARAMVRGHSLRLREVCAARNAGQLFTVGRVVVVGKIECHEADFRATILRLNACNMHVPR
jgi:hypothetical protein